MSTDLLFREDAYLPETEATVVAVSDRRGIVLDRTVFYATGGGQPGDTGRLERAGGPIAIATTVYGDTKADIVHVPADDAPLPAVGETLKAVLDWERRYRHMRIHTGLHLLSVVLPFPVTGGQIGADEGRLDFSIEGEVPPKDEIEARLNELTSRSIQTKALWITDAELDARPDLVRTMSVAPPRGEGRVRLLEIPGVDLQACGGTHVGNIEEIGRLAVVRIRSEGKRNKRVTLTLGT
jgi:misacylated tRNA(Ala) deacylase